MKSTKMFSILIVLIGILVVPNQLFAQEEASFQLAPSSGSYNQGDKFSLELKFNSSEPVTSIKSYLEFDPSTIKVEKIDSTESIFPYWWENIFDNEEGKIQLQASIPSPGEKEGLITKINFQVVDGDKANISFNPSSLALKPNDENILNLTASIGANFSILSTTGKLPTDLKNILAIIFGVLVVLIIFFLIFKKKLIRPA